jgi:hypothetical protein
MGRGSFVLMKTKWLNIMDTPTKKYTCKKLPAKINGVLPNSIQQ